MITVNNKAGKRFVFMRENMTPGNHVKIDNPSQVLDGYLFSHERSRIFFPSIPPSPAIITKIVSTLL
jgi:hypothetical protein